MALTLIAGGHVVDPGQDLDGPADLWLRDGRIIAAPPGDPTPDERYDATGCMVLAGAIDIHSHIAGANVNAARLLLPEWRAEHADAVPIAEEIGCLYTAMGFCLVVEPAVSPHTALQAQLELAAIPTIDTAILTVLGNEDYLLGLLRDGESTDALADYIARALAGSRGLGVKLINPGGAAAFRANARSFGLDDEVPGTGVTSRAITSAVQTAVARLGVPHPVHLHTNNLGIPGNVDTALATIEAAEGRPLHLAHLQFYAYGTEGPRGFSSAAPRLIEALAKHPNVTADVGQVMFGQTVTISSDVLRQYGARNQASPRKWVINDAEGNGGGIVPYRYRRNNFFNAVQWAAGLELFLLAPDPSRLCFTTDHPNGAPFTAYPDLFALLMSRDLRQAWIDTLPKDAMAMTTLPAITREYTWAEIATMTRIAPARLLGLPDRGHLRVGARADIAVYRPHADRAAMFRTTAFTFRDGVLVMRDGIQVARHTGRALAVAPGHDRAVDTRLQRFYETAYGVSHAAFDVPADLPGRALPFETVPCR